MDFTREPIIETVITPKEGCKLVVRSSKSTGQEEYFVDAVEVVSFGSSFFFRSLERPKMFFVPATDYEILEVRETRMVLKNVGIDRTIKIAGGREAPVRSQQRESVQERVEPVSPSLENKVEPAPSAEKPQEMPLEKKRDRRRHSRRRRDRDVTDEEGKTQELGGGQNDLGEDAPAVNQSVAPPVMSALLPPPPTLISETIARYKDNILFKDAFYTKEEQKAVVTESVEPPLVVLEQPEYGSFEVSEAEEDRIYQQRKQQNPQENLESFEPTHSPEDSGQSIDD